MSSFTSQLDVTPLPDGRFWRLNRSFQYHVGSKYAKEVIAVPAKFKTDFASIEMWGVASLILLILYLIFKELLPWWAGFIFLLPAILYLALPKWAKYSKPSVLHDFLYKHHLYSRHMSDLIFYESMRVTFKPYKTGHLISVAFYWAVRLFGFLAWRRKAKSYSPT